MRALLKHNSSVCVRDLPVPALDAQKVRVRVELAGICRTDVYVAQGRIPSPDTLVLGHELAGVVEEVGPEVSDKNLLGQRVGVSPFVGCGACQWCMKHGALRCPDRKMIGVDLDGGFAEFIDLHPAQVHPLEPQVSAQLAAYLEPVAASLAPTCAPITPLMRGVVYGQGRIAALTALVLKLSGFDRVHTHSLEDAPLEANAYDFAVETHATPQAIAALVDALKPRGVLVLKSRAPVPVALDFRAILAKELTLQATEYAPFQRAVALINQHPHTFSHLFGPVHALEDAATAWAVAQEDDKKHFFDPSKRSA